MRNKLLTVSLLLTVFMVGSAQYHGLMNLDNITPSTYGQIYIDATPGPTLALTTAGTFYQVITYTAGEFFGSTVNGAAGTITVGPESAGVYSVQYSVSYTSSNQEIYHFSVFVGAVQHNQCSLEDKAANASDVTNASSQGIISLAAGDVVSLRVSAENNTRTVTTNHVSLMLHRLR